MTKKKLQPLWGFFANFSAQLSDISKLWEANGTKKTAGIELMKTISIALHITRKTIS